MDLCRTGLDERDALLRTLDTTPGWYVPSCARPTATTRDFRQVERWRPARFRHDEHAHAGHRIQQHASHGDRARLWTRLSLLPGRYVYRPANSR
ncbi:MAG: hypothetical protein R3A10_00130 [Caldilineaceae bacterium]